MLRYIALAWDWRDPGAVDAAGQLTARAQSERRRWTTAFASPGLTVFVIRTACDTDSAIGLSSGGVILGRLFPKRFESEDPPEPATLTEGDAARVLSSGGRHLLESFWGRYVAFMRDTATDEIRVLRDPSGGLPCYFTAHRGVTIFFSQIDDCIGLGVTSFSVNWKYMAACVSLIELKINETGLNEVQELLQGQLATVDRGAVSLSQSWDPVEIARAQVLEDPGQATTEASRIVKKCVQAWANGHDGALVALSGGLDSSIVLRTLALYASGTRVIAFNNVVGAGSRCDERHFARIAVEGTRCELRERMMDLRQVRLESVLDVDRTPKPMFYLYDVLHGAFEAGLALESGATASFMGSGGDHVFLQHCAPDMVGDFIFLHGLRPAVMRVARDAAAISRQSAWTLIRHGLRQVRNGSPWNPGSARYMTYFANEDVLNEALRDASYITPPALRGAEGLPLGKIKHIYHALTPHPYYWAIPHAGSPERLAPLFSQPVVELALQLPTYVLGHGGWDRAIERAAFEREVPQQIIRRRLKGASDNASRELVENNIDFLRELLLDGVLVREGLLDRKRLETFLCGSRPTAGREYSELYATRISTEAWLHRWHGLERRAAA